MRKRIVIVGTSSAGISAAVAARKTDLDAEIILISEETRWPYSRCGLPFVISNEVPCFKEVRLFPPSYYRMMKLDLRAGISVKSVNTETKIVQMETLDRQRELVEYDRLVLCTGAAASIPPIEGIEKHGVFSLRTIEDGIRIQKWLENAENAIVVGSGFIGLELAHALKNLDINTTVFERCSHVLPEWFDKDMADLVHKKVQKQGVKVIVNAKVEEILGSDYVTGVRAGGEQYNADTVLLATGARARTQLAKQMGIQLGKFGAIQVNSRMQTSIPEIYAAGDCVESFNLITGQATLSLLGTTAERQGKIAGINAAGGYATFPGVLHSVVSSMFNFEIGATGFTERYAQQNGWETTAGTITAKTRAEYFPGGKPITIKVIVENDLGKIIGGQIIGGEEVTQRVNLLSVAIQNQMSVSELAKADTCYAPSVCSPWEPVILAAETTMMRHNRRGDP
ncbi:MAG: FAD-dependent oxidoreductase [Candidatus Bathyarchaeota archaeon]|nr:MAG: FAD-dependent oxidoreductase [Candidatus Bathyarchaeota archaeon]